MRLHISNLTKTYDGVEVLKNLSIALENVSAVGIIGESGCGKSTLLRQLAGLEVPDCGEIDIDGLSPILSRREFQDKIGYVFQKHNLFPHMSLRDNTLLILEKIRKIDKAQANKRVTKLIEQLHLEAVADKKPEQVSGGQAQRGSIMRALSSQPEILFLDEPTAALDPILTAEVLQSIQELKQTGVNFLFVTHEMEFLRNFCDYVIFMHDGEIIEHGDIDCLASPKTEKLANFLG